MQVKNQYISEKKMKPFLEENHQHDRNINKSLKFSCLYNYSRDPLPGLRQFLTIESLLKVMKNAFYFMLTALFVLETFTFLS